MAEKVSHSETEDRPPCPTAVEGHNPSEIKNDVAKPRINGGLQAWLSVLALFCIFVNSW